MSKVRDDLTGSVLVSNGTFLHAGDEIPEGVTVGDHLIAEEAPKPRAKRQTKADSDDE